MESVLAWPRRCAKLAPTSRSLDEVCEIWQQMSVSQLGSYVDLFCFHQKQRRMPPGLSSRQRFPRTKGACFPLVRAECGNVHTIIWSRGEASIRPVAKAANPPSLCARMDSGWTESLSRNYHGQSGDFSKRKESVSVRGVEEQRQQSVSRLRRYDSGDEQLSGPVVHTCPGCRLVSSHRALGGSWYCNCNSEGR